MFVSRFDLSRKLPVAGTIEDLSAERRRALSFNVPVEPSQGDRLRIEATAT